MTVFVWKGAAASAAVGRMMLRQSQSRENIVSGRAEQGPGGGGEGRGKKGPASLDLGGEGN